MMTQNTDRKRTRIQMFCMDDMVPQDHFLRMIGKAIDWIRSCKADLRGRGIDFLGLSLSVPSRCD